MSAAVLLLMKNWIEGEFCLFLFSTMHMQKKQFRNNNSSLVCIIVEKYSEILKDSKVIYIFAQHQVLVITAIGLLRKMQTLKP